MQPRKRVSPFEPSQCPTKVYSVHMQEYTDESCQLHKKGKQIVLNMGKFL